MKKTIVLTGIAIMAVYGLSAQQLEKGNGLLNFGIGFSSYYTSGSGFQQSVPPLEASYEGMLSEKVSIGGFAGYYGAKYEFDSDPLDLYYQIRYRYLHFGGVANYHLVNDDTFNVYAGGRLGYVRVSTDIFVDSGSEVLEGELFERADAQASGLLFAAQLGARYFLSESIALNAELGYGLTVLKFGASFRM